jgi:hypothetical protein
MTDDRKLRLLRKTLVGLAELADELDGRLIEGTITPTQAINRLDYETLRSIAFAVEACSNRTLREMAQVAIDFRAHTIKKHVPKEPSAS